MTVQHYIKKEFIPGFEQDIRLLYACRADHQQTTLPTVLHSHEDRLELVYLYSGQGIHNIGGNLYHTTQGNLLIYNSNIIHDECANHDFGMSVYTCAISGLKLPNLPQNHLIAKGIRPVLNCENLQSNVLHLFKMMYKNIVKGTKDSEAVSQYLLKALLLIILNQLPLEQENFEAEKNDLIAYIKKYIDTHYLENLTLESLSQTMHISPSFLSHQFKKLTGFAPIQYIMRRRIGKAQSLLISTNESITEIAAMVGYDNTSYFNSIFKKIVGMPPKNYRKYYVGTLQYKQLDRLKILHGNSNK